MKLTPFSLILTILIAILTIGCSTENPICTDSFCLIPRDAVDDTQNIIEIDESKVLALIGKTPEPTLTPTPLTPATPNTLTEIVSDVAAGNTTYLNQTVTITGYVAYKDLKTNEAMIIHTKPNAVDASAQGAVFWVSSFGNPDGLSLFRVNNTYEFTVEIYLIQEPEGDRAYYAIWSRFPE